MKIRNGFVSNSSSSSFVVRRYESVGGMIKNVLAEDDDIGLQQLGFKLQMAYYPDQVSEFVEDHSINEKLDSFLVDLHHWCKHVSCNQDEIVEFLLKARISFTADIHYGHSSMVYDGPSDVLLIAQNFGKQIQMSGTDKMTFASMKETKPVERTTGKKYLKKYAL